MRENYAIAVIVYVLQVEQEDIALMYVPLHRRSIHHNLLLRVATDARKPISNKYNNHKHKYPAKLFMCF